MPLLGIIEIGKSVRFFTYSNVGGIKYCAGKAAFSRSILPLRYSVHDCSSANRNVKDSPVTNPGSTFSPRDIFKVHELNKPKRVHTKFLPSIAQNGRRLFLFYREASKSFTDMKIVLLGWKSGANCLAIMTAKSASSRA